MITACSAPASALVPRRRLVLAAVVLASAALLALGTAGAADAAATGCTGTVTIDGTTYSEANDTRANPIVIPDAPGLVASWSGSTDSVITDFQGSAVLAIASGGVELERWEGPNDDEESSSSGEYAIDDARAFLPFDVVGLYEVEVSHVGSGGTCSGFALVKLEGNPVGTPLGGAAAVGTALAALGVGLAGRKVA